MNASFPILTAGAVLLWASMALAQGYAGDVAIDEEDVVAIGQRHYPPYLALMTTNWPSETLTWESPVGR